MAILTARAEEMARQGRMDRAQRYNGLARRIAMRSKVPMPYGTTICKECLAPLLPGTTGKVRLNQGRVSVTCRTCGTIRRVPYLREKKERRHCQDEPRRT